jgi:hypothetical protein
VTRTLTEVQVGDEQRPHRGHDRARRIGGRAARA